ncbi:hypothetical protein BG842_15465 [Haladaptatus sp. W1]|uniref:hypothetical protein n=1 Tax=Haladaptatus sp. W1 TaxID=1897478 RepID=UPI000849B508|nr:hypothetical protein [Haladaptatus sp. W1]ODR81903.1 hypothetical protein BG842_15465 [Haladaptatus sp. W1]
MADTLRVKSVETTDEYIHVRFRDPDVFDTIRTPDWAADIARDISNGAEVRTGKRIGSDEWEVQSVLIKKQAGTEKARDEAKEIAQEIES